MEQQDIIIKLEAKGIKPTANRILVLKTLASEHHPQSLSNLEHKMLTMDKSSIFRVLTLFLDTTWCTPSKTDEVSSTTNSARKKENATIMTAISTSTARLANAPSAWKTSTSQASNYQKDSIPTPFPLSSRENARNVEKSTSTCHNNGKILAIKSIRGASLA